MMLVVSFDGLGECNSGDLGYVSCAQLADRRVVVD